jgi:hypothetical protein
MSFSTPTTTPPQLVPSTGARPDAHLDDLSTLQRRGRTILAGASATANGALSD